MITGLHAMLYADEPEQARAFFRDVLGLPWIDSGDGWLIFAVPPAELGVHPGSSPAHQVSLICDDLEATVRELRDRGVEFTRPIEDHGYGPSTSLAVPGAGEVELYQPNYARPNAPGGVAD